MVTKPVCLAELLRTVKNIAVEMSHPSLCIKMKLCYKNLENVISNEITGITKVFGISGIT